jgi:hypothetical protein
MKLYICWGTFQTPRPGGHPCANAYTALKEAGWDPEVQKTYGWAALGNALNPTRKPVRELTGKNWVPVLVTDDGEVIQESKKIVEWAKANPAAGAEGAKAAS